MASSTGSSSGGGGGGLPSAHGLLNALRGSTASLIEHVRLRIELLEVEGREAALHLLLLAGLVALAALLLVFGYLLILLGGLFLLASVTGWDWVWVAFVAGIVHVVGAGVLLLQVRTRSRRKLLADTIEEFKRDSQWLRKNTTSDHFPTKTS